MEGDFIGMDVHNLRGIKWTMQFYFRTGKSIIQRGKGIQQSVEFF